MTESVDDFSFRATADGRVLISWRGRQVATLAGDKAQWFLQRVEGATPAKLQVLMARATGNFKRGNERGR
jgi:hypothetical protein